MTEHKVRFVMQPAPPPNAALACLNILFCLAVARLGQDRESRLRRISKRKTVHAQLAGVGQSAEERDFMLVQANNGRRRLHVEERQTVAGPWYGIYVY